MLREKMIYMTAYKMREKIIYIYITPYKINLDKLHWSPYYKAYTVNPLMFASDLLGELRDHL